MLLPILVSALLGFVTTPIVSHWVAQPQHNKNPLTLSLVSSILIGSITGLIISKDITITIFCALAGIGGWLISLTVTFFKMTYLSKYLDEFNDQY
jgi:hypothetical protein